MQLSLPFPHTEPSCSSSKPIQPACPWRPSSLSELITLREAGLVRIRISYSEVDLAFADPPTPTQTAPATFATSSTTPPPGVGLANLEPDVLRIALLTPEDRAAIVVGPGERKLSIDEYNKFKELERYLGAMT